MKDEEKSKEQLISELVELRHTLSDIKESERDYRDLFERSVDGLAVIDAETLKIILCNRRAASLYGFNSPNDVIGVNPLDFIHPEDRDRAIKHIVDYLFKQDLREANTFRTITRDGEDKWISAVGIVIDYHGKKAALASFRDITQSKRMEDALRQSEESLQITFESIKEGITITDLEGRIVMTNEAALRMSGYNRKEEVVGRSGLDFIADRDRAKAMADLASQLTRKVGSTVSHYTMIDREGNEYFAEVSASVMPDIHGNPIGFIAVVRDITARRQMERALLQSEEKLRSTFESIDDSIVVIDSEGHVIDVNEAAIRIVGFNSKKEVIGINAFELISPQDRERVMRDFASRQEGHFHQRMEYAIRPIHGEEFVAEVTASSLSDTSGNPIGYIAVIRDITERNRAVEELRKSEERYRLVTENVSDVIWIMDMNINYTYISPSVKRMRGYTPEEMMSLPAQDLVTPESAAQMLKILAEELTLELSGKADPHRVRTLEMETKNKDGSMIWIEVKITFMRDPEGKPIGLLGVSRDITERKRIEEALRGSEEKLRLTFESLNEAIVLTDLEGFIVDINEAGFRMSGYKSKSQVIGLNGLQFFEEKARPSVLEQLARLLKEGRIPIMSYKIISKTGLVYDCEISAVLLHDKAGNPLSLIVVIRDVSERKRIEEALRDSEEKLRLTFESIEDGIVITDVNGCIKDVNEATLRIGGFLDKSQVIGRNAFELIAPKDYRTVMDDLKASLEGRPKGRMEYSIQPRGSKVVEVELTASIMRNEEGDPAEYIAVLRDITDRKQAENQLRESERKYKELVERETDIIFSVDNSGMVTSINSAVAMWGYTPEEIIGKQYSDFVPANLLENLEAVLPTRLMTTGEVVAEAMGLDKDGNWRPIEFSGTVILKGTQFAGVRGIVRDITERKRTEEALRQRNRELATLNKIAEAVSHPVGLNRVLRTALDSVLETMHFQYGSIWLVEAGSLELHLATARGSRDLLITIADMNDALKTGESTVAAYSSEGKTSNSDKTPPITEDNNKSVIGIPLKSKGDIFGVLGVVGDSQALSDDDMRLLEIIGDQIAVAIENAQLLEKLNKLSITDDMTKLGNRRHFYEVLESEMNRTRRYGRCTSIAMIDLDGFKKYNDRFGHASGDLILVDFAGALKEGLRKTDSAFRYGGDEFAVILPSTNAERAQEVIERIRRKWLKKLSVQQPGLENTLGFSAGIAQFPENAETVDGLVFLTDTALYYAKRGGKQRVMVISDLGTTSLDVLSSPTLDQIYALAATVDTRDPFTYGHSKRVAAIAESLGRAIGLKGDELSELVAAAFLHDIGKVGVADVILTKPGKPEKEEWEAIKKHCAEGAKIIQHVKELAPLAPYILHHHEWYDGSGYPEKLKGEEIPLSARIISVADAYDTMTAQRPYREAISPQEALEEMERCSGTQFDPKLIEALRRISKSGIQIP